MRTSSPLRVWKYTSIPVRISFFAIAIAAGALFSAAPSVAQQGALSVPLDLARMVDESENIVLGRVTSVKAEKHPDYQNLDTVVVTLQIVDPMKGSPGASYTFRQYVFDVHDRDTNLGYRVGEEVVLMLRPPSQSKLTSPVGFEQGRFRVERDAQGKRSLRNGQDNVGLFSDVEKTRPNLKNRLTPAVQQLVTQHQSGWISYEDFKSFVQSALAARQAAQ